MRLFLRLNMLNMYDHHRLLFRFDIPSSFTVSKMLIFSSCSPSLLLLSEHISVTFVVSAVSISVKVEVGGVMSPTFYLLTPTEWVRLEKGRRSLPLCHLLGSTQFDRDTGTIQWSTDVERKG